MDNELLNILYQKRSEELLTFTTRNPKILEKEEAQRNFSKLLYDFIFTNIDESIQKSLISFLEQYINSIYNKQESENEHFYKIGFFDCFSIKEDGKNYKY